MSYSLPARQSLRSSLVSTNVSIATVVCIRVFVNNANDFRSAIVFCVRRFSLNRVFLCHCRQNGTFYSGDKLPQGVADMAKESDANVAIPRRGSQAFSPCEK